MAASRQRCLDPVQDLFCFLAFLPQGNAMPRDSQRSSRDKDDAKNRHLVIKMLFPALLDVKAAYGQAVFFAAKIGYESPIWEA